jgi:predicted Rossmann fold nucleotide-binding protein DprA/Smf involved in DNA uptake
MKKHKPFILEPFVEFMTERIRVPTRKEVDRLIKKTEESLSSLKVPSKAEFDKLTKRVEALENALKTKKKAERVTKPAKKPAVKKKVSGGKRQVTNSEKVLRVITKTSTGADMATLKAETGLEDKKIRDTVFRLSKQGKIKRTGRGVYKAQA